MLWFKNKKRIASIEKKLEGLSAKLALTDTKTKKMDEDILAIMDVCSNLILCYTKQDDKINELFSAVSVILAEMSGRKSTADPNNPKKPNLPN
jgi:hypothetical protein